MNWYEYPIVVPFGNPNYDSGLGGSHDMDVAPPPNTPVTALLPGKITDLSMPSWGMQVCLLLDTPYNNIGFMAYLHLAAINTVWRIGMHVNVGDLIGWTGGANTLAQYLGTRNPTNVNFLNSVDMSSQVQTGVALMRGPVYGSGNGWEVFPPIDMALDPTQIILAARSALTMAVDYPGASAHFVPDSYTFTSNAAKAIVIHKTATGGPGGLQSVFNTFMATMRSTHYGIDLDGSVWQFVPEARGAGGNCCLEVGHNSFWDQYTGAYPNLNLCTFSIEHVDPTTDNSNPMPQAQVDASHKLVAYLCKKYNIDTAHIHSHASLDPLSKARCPGSTYDFQALFDYVNGAPAPMPTPNYQRLAFEQEWTSIVPTANPLTGIAKAAWTDYQAGKYHGPPLKTAKSDELGEEDGKNNNGLPIKIMRLPGGRYEWDGSPHFYPYQ